MNRTAAFTLIEVIIAAFIALVIFTVGFSSISTIMAVRKDSEKRIVVSEDARMLCKTLARDLAGAYPMYLAGSPPTPLLTLSTNWKPQDTLNQKDGGIAVAAHPSDRLEFYSHVDHRGVADDLVFVRYFVNNFGHLCREVVDSIDPSSMTPPSTDTRHHYPQLLTQIPPFDASSTGTDLNDDTDAVFDSTNAIFFNPLQWSPNTKDYSTPPLGWPQATHIQVEILMYDQVQLMENDQAGIQDKKGRFGQRRTFIQVLELPYSLKQRDELIGE